MKVEIEKRMEFKKERGAKKCYSLTSLDLFASFFFILKEIRKNLLSTKKESQEISCLLAYHLY